MMSYMMFNAMKLKLYCYYPCPSMLAAHAYWRSEKSRFIGTEAQSIFFMQTTDIWLCFCWRRRKGKGKGWLRRSDGEEIFSCNFINRATVKLI